MVRLLLAVVAAAGGGLVVGPHVSYAAVRWVGWRVTLPLLLGHVPARGRVGAPPPGCRACGGRLWLGHPRTLPWVTSRGRCRHCGEPLAWWSAGAELVTATCFGAAAWWIGWTWALAPVLVLATGLVAASLVDLACWRIPTRFVYLTLLAVAAAVSVAAVAGGAPGSLLGAVVGGVGYFAFLAALHLVSPRLLGFGDVRLGLVVGVVVGWMGWTDDLPVLGPLAAVLRAVFVASLAGLVVGVVLLAVRRSSRPYPFGPWLSLGAFVTVLMAAPGPV